MISVARAIKIIQREVTPHGFERSSLTEAVGRVLAEEVLADMDLPPFDRSMMDGYAVIAKDSIGSPVSLEIVGESAAGNGWRGTLGHGQSVRIMTGAPVPKGADAVQKIELTREADGRVTLLEPVRKETAIVRQGAEIKRGTRIIRPGELVTDAMIAVLASFGYAKVAVGKRPRITILGTGSEIVDITRKPGKDQIRNSNSIMLDVLCRRFGAETTVLPIVADDISELKKAIRSASRRSQFVVITGGVSVGKYDHTKTALTDLGAEIFIERIRLKPGKPMVFARLGTSLIFGLPGNPVSATVTFHLFVRTAILRMQGLKIEGLRMGHAVLGSDIKANRERDTYLPSSLETTRAGQLVAQPLKWQGSSDFVGFAQADSLIRVPKGESIPKGGVGEIAYL